MYSITLASSEAGQCNSLTVTLCKGPLTISCESGSQENKSKNKKILLKINKFFKKLIFKSGSLLFVAPGYIFVNDITNYSDRVFSSQLLLSHNKFLHTLLHKSNGLKQNTKLL